MANEIKDELTVRPEFVEEIQKAMKDLRAKATTQGEVGVLYFMLRAANNCMEQCQQAKCTNFAYYFCLFLPLDKFAAMY